MKCEDAQENLYEYLDGSLSPSETASLRQHLEECATCRQVVQREMDFARSTSSRLERAVDEVRLEPHARRRIVQAVEKKLAHSGRRSELSSWLRIAWGFAAALALLAVIIGSKYRFGSPRHPQPQLARVPSPLTAPEIMVHLDYCAPTYTFHRAGNTVIDSLVCESRATEASLVVKN